VKASPPKGLRTPIWACYKHAGDSPQTFGLEIPFKTGPDRPALWQAAQNRKRAGGAPVDMSEAKLSESILNQRVKDFVLSLLQACRRFTSTIRAGKAI